MKLKYISVALFVALTFSTGANALSSSQDMYSETAAIATPRMVGIFEIVRVIIADQLNIDESYIHLESNFRYDLGADSLDICIIIIKCEQEFACDIPDEKAENIVTVYDLCELIWEYELNIFQ